MHAVRLATSRLSLGLGRRAAAAAASRSTVMAFASGSAQRHSLLTPAPMQSLRSFSLTRTVANSEANTEDTSADLAPAEDAGAADAQVQDTRAAAGDDTPYGIFVRNLVFAATEQHLTDAFQKYGKISKAIVARDARGLSKGFGFVYFFNEQDRRNAIAGADGSFWHGRRIHASIRDKAAGGQRAGSSERGLRPMTDGNKSPTNCLYIGNIPYETTDSELNKLFQSLPNVTDVRIAVDRSTGWPRGFAHADFSDVNSAIEAARQLEGRQLLGRNLRVDFSAPSRNSANKEANGLGDSNDIGAANPL